MLAFAANSVLNRLAVGAGLIDAVDYAVIRLAAGAVTLTLLVAARRVIFRGAVWPEWSGRVAGVLGLLTYLFAFSAAYLALDAGTGALILFGSVQITMFAGAIIAREPVPPARWAGAGLAFAGLLVLVAPVGGESIGTPGPLAAMGLAGVGWGVYSLAGRGGAGRGGAGRGATDPVLATAANFLLALPLAVGVGLVFGAGLAFGGQAVLRPQGVWLAVLSGSVTSGLGYALWYGVVPRLGAARAAVAQLTVPVLAAAGGAALLDEAVGLRFLLASGLVLSGVWLASIVRR